MSERIARLSAALADRYRIERELGAGGMATVYLAQDLRHKRKVAVKVLRPELAAVLGAERFVHEITTTANLQHPNILPLFDSGEADGFLYYVMPYIEGETLRDKLNRDTQLSIEAAVLITTEVAHALHSAHRQGVVHRDIKPENILLHDGRPMVADFGIALAVSAAAGGRMTETGLSLGTPHYMSPEQATAEKEITARSDVYSLGSVLYEMLTGEPPHSGGSAQQIIMKIVTDTPRPVMELRKSTPPNVAAAVTKALEKLPADRFESAATFAEALTNPGFTLPSTALAPGARHPSTARARARSHAWIFAAVAGWLVALALFATVLGSRRNDAVTSRHSVRRATLVLPDSAMLAFVGQTPLGVGMPALAISPDGSTLAYVAQGTHSVQLYVRQLDRLDVVGLPGTEGAYAPFFSPDGEWVGFFSGTELKKVRVAGGSPVTLAQLQLPYGAVWGPDDRILASVREGDQAVWVSASGGTPVAIDGVDGVLPQFLGSSDWIISALPNRLLRITSLETGEDFGINPQGLVPAADLTETTDLLYGSNPRYVESGHIVYLSGDGVVFALPFDGATRTVGGTPEIVLEGVRQEAVWGAGQLAVAGDGTLVYAEGENAGLARLVWRDGSGAVDTLSAFPRAQYGKLDLSPDGSRIVVQVLPAAGPAENWLLDLAQGVRSVLGGGGRTLQWWPDGQQLAFTMLDPFSTVRFDASAPDVPDTIPGWALWETAADGTLLFGSDSTLAVGTSVSTDAQPRVLGGYYHGWGYTVNRGGSWIGFTSDVTKDSKYEIYLLHAEPPYQLFHVSPLGGEEPIWSPTGELVYREGNRWMAVTPPSRPGERPAPPRFLFEGTYQNVLGRSHDIAPDDRHLLLAAPAALGTSQLVLVTNFFEELKAKVGN